MSSSNKTRSLSFWQLITAGFDDYLKLIKMRLTSLVVFTALGSFLVASSLSYQIIDLLLLAVGGFGVAGASNALNQVLEKDYDKLMTRTQDRPIAAGRMSMSHGVLFAGFLCLLGVTALALFNMLTAFLGMLAFMTYAFIYTPMKRYSRAAVFVGAIAGAMPMLIGVVAFSGSITWLALALFILQFAWQYPHFWAIGFLGFEDYNKAGFKFVPSEGGRIDRSIGISSICYALSLVILAVVMIYTQMTGYFSGAVLILLGAIYTWTAIVFYRKFDMSAAKRLMFGSLIYLPVAMLVLIIDKI